MLSAICVDHLCSNLNVSGIDYICLVTVCNHSVPRIYSLWFDCTWLTPITWYLNHSNLDRTAWINKSSSVGNILQPHATNSMIFHMVAKKRTEMYFDSTKKNRIYRYVYIDDTNMPSIFLYHIILRASTQYKTKFGDWPSATPISTENKNWLWMETSVGTVNRYKDFL